MYFEVVVADGCLSYLYKYSEVVNNVEGTCLKALVCLAIRLFFYSFVCVSCCEASLLCISYTDINNVPASLDEDA